VTGTVIGRGQVAISVAPPRPAAADTTSSLRSDQTAAPVAIAANSNPPAAPKAE